MPNIKIPTVKVPKVPKVPVPRVTIGGEGTEKITPAVRRAVWEKRFGSKERALCYCCKKNWIYNRVGGYECGHRRARVSGGGMGPESMEPICSQCNKMMQNHNLESWCTKRREELKKDSPKVRLKAKKQAAPKKKTTPKKRSTKKK